MYASGVSFMMESILYGKRGPGRVLSRVALLRGRKSGSSGCRSVPICNSPVGNVIGYEPTRLHTPVLQRIRRRYHACDIRSLMRDFTSRVLLLVALVIACGEHVHARTAAGVPAASPQKLSPRPTPAKARGRYDDYQVPAGTPLATQLRTSLDSGSGQIDDLVRGTLLEAVSQDGVELIPKGSTLHGKVVDVLHASRQNRVGRLVLVFHVIEHVETRSLASIETRAVTFDATLGSKEKFRDVRVPADERMTVTLTSPLKVHIPRNR